MAKHRHDFLNKVLTLFLFLWSPLSSANTNNLPAEFIFIERPPYTYQQNGRLQGVLVDIMRANLTSVSFAYKELLVTNWSDILTMLKREKTMCTVGAYVTDERLKFYKYSAPILEESGYVAVANRRLVEAFGTSVSLKTLYTSDFVFGFQKGFSYGETIDTLFIDADINKVELSFILLKQGQHTERHIFTLVNRGQIDYFFMNPIEFHWNIKKQESNKNNIVALNLSPSVPVNARHLMCHKDFPDAYLNEFNRLLGQLKHTDEYEALLKKYL